MGKNKIFAPSRLCEQKHHNRMSQNKNALIRYKTIDKCLQNKYRQWTLEDLIECCSQALEEYEGRKIPISKRTIQMDIQMMRSDKLGYNAPIITVDKKYYTYEDADYSITNLPLTEMDFNRMSEALEVLKQFKGIMNQAIFLLFTTLLPEDLLKINLSLVKINTGSLLKHHMN